MHTSEIRRGHVEEIDPRTKAMYSKAIEERIAMRVGWEQVWKAVYTKTITPENKDTLADIFLLGCAHAFKLVMIMSEDDISEDDGAAMMSKIDEEINDFLVLYYAKYGVLLQTNKPKH
jgi:hypothetical protein